MVIYNSTFAGNFANQGAEITNISSTSTLFIANTVFACAPENNVCYEFVLPPATTNSILGVGALQDFGLAGLADNGGPTQTMALLPGSSLIDAGDDATCANTPVNSLDQRGVSRPQGEHCDIGAYEHQASILSPGDTVRISINSTGDQGNGDSYWASTSADGRYAVFYSGATNLVSGDTNADDDVFVHDTVTGLTKRVSVDSNGIQGNDHSWMPSISSDGRYIVFSSLATNLVSDDTNGKSDVFLHDIQTNITTRVSIHSNGAQANDSSYGSIQQMDDTLCSNLVPQIW